MDDFERIECSKCQENAEFFCNCKSYLSYFCLLHKENHRRTPGNHKIDNAYVSFTNKVKSEISSSLAKKIDFLTVLKQETISSTHAIILTAEQKSSEFIRKIDQMIEEASNEQMAFLTQSKVFHTKTEYFLDLKNKNYDLSLINYDVSKILNSIDQLYPNNILEEPQPVNNPLPQLLDRLLYSNYASTELKVEKMLENQI